MKRYSSVFVAAVPGVVALLFLVGALRMPSLGNVHYSPGLFPIIVSGVMALLSALLVLQEGIKARNAEAPAPDAAAEPREKGRLVRTAYIIGAMVLFVALIWYRVSFVFSSALFLFLTLFYFARNRTVSNLLLILAMSWGMHYVFTRLFFIPLP